MDVTNSLLIHFYERGQSFKHFKRDFMCILTTTCWHLLNYQLLTFACNFPYTKSNISEYPNRWYCVRKPYIEYVYAHTGGAPYVKKHFLQTLTSFISPIFPSFIPHLCLRPSVLFSSPFPPPSLFGISLLVYSYGIFGRLVAIVSALKV